MTKTSKALGMLTASIQGINKTIVAEKLLESQKPDCR